MASWHGGYIHALEILASSPLSKGSRDFNRGEQSRAPLPLLHVRHRNQPPRPPPPFSRSCSSVCSHDASDIHGLLAFYRRPKFLPLFRPPSALHLAFKIFSKSNKISFLRDTKISCTLVHCLLLIV